MPCHADKTLKNADRKKLITKKCFRSTLPFNLYTMKIGCIYSKTGSLSKPITGIAWISIDITLLEQSNIMVFF